ncbi:hypothetical protein B9Z55_025281 [Caenorhabditis nigoni]|uniref:Uncharacterized protein n=2 Tax=Caenorhabditis nigoni TaxID=1611254 RepID=A0A2G5SY60_9PELO|nr:hypothetical protein B9Z55_025281 [Caenorhabditis nigoni]
MGGADGMNAAPTSATGRMEWRRTPITSQSGNGTLTNPDWLGKESRGENSNQFQYKTLTDVWNDDMLRILPADWDHMVEYPLPGCEQFGFKELVPTYYKMFEVMAPEKLPGAPSPGSPRRPIDYPSSKDMRGPVFDHCQVDPEMFRPLMNYPVKKQEYVPMEQDVAHQMKYLELENKTTPGTGASNNFGQHARTFNPATKNFNPAQANAKVPNNGYKPKNLDAEFPNLNASVENEQEKKKATVEKKPQYHKKYHQNNIDYRKPRHYGRRDDLINQEYINNQINKLVQEDKKTSGEIAQEEKKEVVEVPQKSHYYKKHQYQNHYQHQNHHQRHHHYQHYQKPHQTASTMIRVPVPGPPVYLQPSVSPVGTSVVDEDGVTNNFQNSRGFRQWTRWRKIEDSHKTLIFRNDQN